MTSSQKSADVGKILNQGVLFLVDLIEFYNSAGLYLNCFIFKDFREGGRNPPPPSNKALKKAQYVLVNVI